MPPPQSQITLPSGGRKADAKPTQLPVALPPQPERMVTPTFFNAAGNSAMNTLVSADSELMTAVAARGGSFASANPGFGAPTRDRSQAAAGLHDGVTKQPVTPERLLTWAVKQGRSPAELYASIQSSYDFIGSEDDRRAAVQTLALYMDDVQQAIAHNRAEAEKVAEADYQKKGAAREPLGDRQLLISLKDLQQVEAGPNFSEPLRAYNMISGSHVTYVKGQEINGYTVVSPQRGIVQKDGYYFQLGESGLNELYSGYHPPQSNVFQREAFKGTEGIGLAYGYALEAAGFAMQFGPVLSRAMAPFISKSGEGIVHDMHAGEAKLKGEDFDEPAPEVGWDTLFEGLASAAAPEIGNKASGAVEKVVAPVLGKAAPLAGKVAGSLTGQYASQVIQKTPDLVSGKASISEVATPHVSASGVAQDLAFGAAHHVAGKVADKIAPGRTLKSEAPHQAPAAKHGGEAKASPPHAEAPAAKAVEPPASAPRTAPTPTGKKPQSPTLSRPTTKAKPQRAKAASAPIKKAASEQIKKENKLHPGSVAVTPKHTL